MVASIHLRLLVVGVAAMAMLATALPAGARPGERLRPTRPVCPDHHMRVAAERGLIAVTMDYRGLAPFRLGVVYLPSSVA